MLFQFTILIWDEGSFLQKRVWSYRFRFICIRVYIAPFKAPFSLLSIRYRLEVIRLLKLSDFFSIRILNLLESICYQKFINSHIMRGDSSAETFGFFFNKDPKFTWIYLLPKIHKQSHNERWFVCWNFRIFFQ